MVPPSPPYKNSREEFVLRFSHRELENSPTITSNITLRAGKLRAGKSEPVPDVYLWTESIQQRGAMSTEGYGRWDLFFSLAKLDLFDYPSEFRRYGRHLTCGSKIGTSHETTAVLVHGQLLPKPVRGTPL